MISDFLKGVIGILVPIYIAGNPPRNYLAHMKQRLERELISLGGFHHKTSPKIKLYVFLIMSSFLYVVYQYLPPPNCQNT